MRRKTINEHHITHITFFNWYPILKWRFCNLREVDILLMACLLSLTGHYWVKGVDGWATRSKLFLFLANKPWKPEGTPQFKATTAVCAATFRLSICSNNIITATRHTRHKIHMRTIVFDFRINHLPRSLDIVSVRRRRNQSSWNF